MGALPRPHVAPGPHRELVDALHSLHHRAGWPSLRHLASQTGVSHTTVSKALSSPALPSWGTVELLVGAMRGDVTSFRTMWLEATAPPEATRRSGVTIAGRAAELGAVCSHLQDGSGLLLLTGEAGIGKTVLVNAAAAETDIALIRGTCLQLSREVPLLPVIGAIRTLHDDPDRRLWMDEALRACPPYVVPALARLLPELNPEGTVDANNPWRGAQLVAAVGRLLRALDAIRPVALHVEDCHWADHSTLDLLAHLATASSSVPVVTTWRTGDPEVTRGHSEWLTKIGWTPGVKTIELRRLTRAETAQQLRMLTASTAAAVDPDRVYARSEGHPLYTAQLAASPTAEHLPPRLADLLDSRIGDVDHTTWRVARLLGVAQRRLRPRVLVDATGLDDEAVDEALRVLAMKGLLRTAQDDAELSHPLFIEAIQRRLVPGEAARVHARLAETLTGESDVEPAEVADHWRAADRPEQEAAHRLSAARRADQRFAAREALTEWLRVLELWDVGARVDDLNRWDATARALEAAWRVGNAEAGRRLLDATNMGELTVTQRAMALQWRVPFNPAGSADDHLALADEALALLETQPPSADLEELLVHRIWFFMQRGRIKDAQADLRRGLELRDAIGDERSRRRWTPVSIAVTMRSGDLDGAVAMTREALRTQWAETDPMADMQLAVTATDIMGYTAILATEVQELVGDTLRAIDEHDLTLTNTSLLIHGYLARAYLHQGDVAAARTLLEPVTRFPPDPNTAAVHYMLSAVELREGNLQGAVERCVAASAEVRPGGQNSVALVPWQAELELWSRRPEQASWVLDRALEDALPTDMLMIADLLRWHARAHADRLEMSHATAGERHRLVQQLEAMVAGARSSPFASHDREVSVPACAATWRAELARTAATESVDVWVSAATEWDRIARPHDTAYCLWRAARLAFQHGQGTVAARLLKRAAPKAVTHVPLKQAIASTSTGTVFGEL
jgi:tetratricopeptide (TPR) repeat protein